MYKLDEFKKKLLDISIEFKRICDENELKYFMDGGTFLGAVRHQGFIPWDDDVDFCMPRKDFDKFLDVARKELDDGYALRFAEQDGYIYGYAKIDDVNTSLTDSYNPNYKGGVFIDIFPLDGLPKKELTRKLYIKYIRLLKKIANISMIDYSLVKNVNVIKRVINKIFRLFNGKKLLNKIIKTAKKYEFDSNEYVASVMDWVKPIPKEIFNESQEYVFEGVNFTGVKDYDKMLKLYYGDYMELPPENKRVTSHDNINVDLNQSYKNR